MSIPIQLDETQFQKCCFNLLMSPGSNYPLVDFGEQLLIVNQGGQLWTISTMPLSEDTPFAPIQNHAFLKESCSINSIVSIQDCIGIQLDLLTVFGSRLFNAENSLIVIMSAEHPCNPTLRALQRGFGSWLFIDIGLIYLSRNMRQVEFGISYCRACSKQNIRYQLFVIRWCNNILTFSKPDCYTA